MVDPATHPLPKGDPSSSLPVAVEQYRTRYIFLAPDDYDVSFIDVVAPTGATLTLDAGQTATSGSDGQFRFPCVPEGRHTLSATAAGFAKHDLTLTAPPRRPSVSVPRANVANAIS